MEECVAFVVLCSLCALIIAFVGPEPALSSSLLLVVYGRHTSRMRLPAVGEFGGVMISVSCSPYVVTIEMNFSGSPASSVGRPGIEVDGVVPW